MNELVNIYISKFIFSCFRYHHFHTMPIEFGEEEYVMLCVPEPENRYDNLAVLVKEENSNQIIGRVPRYICNTISLGFRVSKKLIRALCLYTGTHHNEGPIQGGGIKLHCVYVLEYEPSTLMQEIVQVAGFLKDHVPDNCIYL